MIDSSKIQTISIIGTGTMGQEIAEAVLLRNDTEKVILNDINEEALIRAKKFIFSSLEKLQSKNKLAQSTTPTVLMNKLALENDFAKAVKDADYIIEVIPEILSLKQELIEKLNTLSRKNTIIASNTSNMRITDIAKFSTKKDKIVGMHFFTPVIILKAIEIIKGEQTSDLTMEISESFAYSLPCLRGERYLIKIYKETPGFIVNRINAAICMYFNWLLEEGEKKGLPPQKIGADIVSFQGGGLGPFAKWDYLGLDVLFHSFQYYADTLSPQFTPNKIFTDLVDNGRLGKKTNVGFYKWTKDDKPIVDYSQKANIFDPELLIAVQLNEGCRLLEEGVVDNYKQIDKAMINAMDMPGPFALGKRSYQHLVSKLEDFVEKSNLTYLKPCSLFKEGKFLEMRKS